MFTYTMTDMAHLSQMPFAVRIVDGRGVGSVFLLGAYTTIGREKCDIVVDERDTKISRLHGTFQCLRDNIVVFTNVGFNGTLLERKDKSRRMLTIASDRTRSALMYEGDALVMGSLTLRVIAYSAGDVVFVADFPDEAAAVDEADRGADRDEADAAEVVDDVEEPGIRDGVLPVIRSDVREEDPVN